MKKLSLSIVLVVMAIVMVLTACSPQETTTPDSTTTKSGTTSATSVDDENFYADIDGKKLSYWYPMWAWEAEFIGDGDMGNLWIYAEIERRTGVEIEWILPPVDNEQAKAAYNVLIAGADLPDIITHPYYHYYPGGSDKAIEDEVYLDLKDLMQEYSPHYWHYLTEDGETIKLVTTDAGNIWCYYMIDSFAQPSYGGPVWRKDFLDKVGSSVPTTIGEMYDTLVKFRDDLELERPIFDESDYLASAYGVKSTFINDNGTVKFGPVEDGWKEYLTEMHRWYEEGIIPQDYVAPPELRVAMLENKVGAASNMGFNNITEYTSLASDIPDFELIAAPYPRLNKDDPKVDFKKQNYRAQQNCTAITTNCEEPWVAAKWLDVKFTDEFILKGNYGEEGVAYTMVDGEPQYTDALINPEEPGMTLGILLYKHAFGKGPYYRIMDRNWFTHLPHAIDAMYLWDDSSTGEGELPEPFLSMPAEEGERFSTIMADINSYVAECRVNFIIGDMSLDDWDTYINTIKDMGLEEALGLKQASYDRLTNR